MSHRSRSRLALSTLHVVSVAVGVIAIGLGLPSVLADSSTINFESPTYVLGSPNGQDGWTSPAICATYDHAIASNIYGYASFGGQSLRMSNAVTSGCFDGTFSKALVDEAGESNAYVAAPSGVRQPYFTAQWDFASTVPNAEQPGLSVVASPDKGDGGRMSWLEMADTPTGLQVNFYDYQDAVPYGSNANPADGIGPEDNFVFTTVASNLDRTVPHTVRLEVTLIDGPHNDIVKVYVDGTLRHTGTSWEDYFRWNQGPGDAEETAPVRESRVIRGVLFRTGGTAAPATAGNGFLVDNLTLFSGPVPPPPPNCAGSTDCYVDTATGDDTNGGTNFATDAKKTIQAAIDAVAAGGTVHVNPGAYSESPVIAKSLTLVSSSGRGVTTIQLQAGPEYLGALTIKGNASTVRVDGFTIAGSDGSPSSLANSNVVVYSGQASNTPSSVTIANDRLRVANVDATFSNGDDGIGLLTYYNDSGSSEVGNISVRGTIFEPVHGIGSTVGTRAFYINPGVVQFDFSVNLINGQFNSSSYTQAKGALLDQNTLTGVGSAGSRSGGLGTWGYPDPTVYGHAVFQNNVIDGTSGIHLYESQNVTVNNNFLTNNDAAVSVAPSIPLPFDASTIHIKENSITGNVNGVQSDPADTGTVNAEQNWWGSASGPTNAGNPSGTGDKVAGDVDFDPWLCDGTDTLPGVMGFQPNLTTSPCVSPGGLTVTKTVNWSGAPPNTAQTFSICISGPSYPSGNCKPVGYSGGPVSWSGLIAGSYVVSETSPGSAWTVTISGSPANVVGGQTAQAGVTNTLKPGKLVVTKVVDCGSFHITQSFQLCIAGPSYPTPNCKTIGPNGGPLTWSNIAPGNYTVTESNPGSDWVVGISGSPAAVPPAGAASAKVTNSKPKAAIAVKKNGPAIAIGGSAVTFTYSVTNPGNVPLTNVAVTDNKCSPVVYASGDVSNLGALDPGETWTYACTYTPAFSAASLTNKATASGKFGTQTVSATDTFTLYPLTVKKRVYLYWDTKASPHTDHSVPYGPADNTAFTVQAYKGSVLVGTYTIAQNAPQKLWLGSGSYTFKEINLPAGYQSANGPIQFGTGPSCSNEVTFANLITFDLAVDKTGPVSAHKGDTVSYTYKVTNAGPASIKPKVADDKCSPVSLVAGGDVNGNQRLDVGETWTFTCAYKVPNVASVTNKATVTDAESVTCTSNVGGDRNSANNKDTWTLTVTH